MCYKEGFFITEDTGGKRQTHYNIRTRVNKTEKEKTEGKLANTLKNKTTI